jgi:DNA-binding HxlR family transcriptional regulator
VLYALARRRWDIAIIVALGNGPSRFVELRDAAAMWMRRPCYNAELSRILPILIANGYVTGPHDKSEATYALTDRGRARLATFNALGGALDDEPRCRVTDL